METKLRSRTLSYAFILIVGALLFYSSEILARMDSFWGGLGLALFLLASLRLLQVLRLKTNSKYAEKWRIEVTDERNIYISKEARSKTFYYSVMIEAILLFIFTALEMTEYTKVLSAIFVGQLCLYYVMYLVLKKIA